MEPSRVIFEREVEKLRARGKIVVEPREFAPALSAVAAGKLLRSGGYERVRGGRGRVPPLWDITSR